ncbi:MAG: NADP-dependent oxidoreductase, partial [Pseudomonadota bacterium]
APLEIGDVLHGRGVAQIVKSRHPEWREGQIVQGQLGWQTYKVSSMTPAEKFRAMPPNGLSASLGLGALGMTGLSAWAGFYNVGAPHPGDIVLVSGAVGGVGSLVTQFAAQVSGCDVIGIAGGAEKCDLARDLGCGRVIDYKSDDIPPAIAAAVPNGLDIYFDNVGGEILDAAMDHLSQGARIVLCGSISEYTRERPFALPNYTRLRRTDSQMRGFFVYNHLHDWDHAMREIADWIRDGRVKPVEQITDGFERMPAALAGLYTGQNVGKQLCRVRGEPETWI